MRERYREREIESQRERERARERELERESERAILGGLTKKRGCSSRVWVLRGRRRWGA